MTQEDSENFDPGFSRFKVEGLPDDTFVPDVSDLQGTHGDSVDR